ncbi:MAG: FHA domain-containing protein [Acidobacteria bacterium]|nr:MAG: FHA domain-containing protein [Acidobacteriota bacterium]
MSDGESTAAAAPGEVIDVLVVGGGPGGTAAAFRAHELGLRVQVIDYDDLMKRIRDYSKDKLILPGFGGGDRMRFPRGGELISALCFGPIDKDEMCATWKELYRRHGVAARTGVELTGVEQRDDGVYRAVAWDHGAHREISLLARHLVLAIGRGVPRRFDIPGTTDGIAFRLGDPRSYVGRPACVIGGGTSAAEAVIAISCAKAAAGDATAVYWSYRGDKMPRVSKALAEDFFEAYVGNGNVRYFPRSEPAAVVTGDDRREYLAIRIDRRRMEGRPVEAVHLELPKASCVACIGEDVPEALLSGLGVPLVTGGPRNRKRALVNRYLESVRPNLYLIGDLLSQAYFETDDFAADPASWREVKHRGNIKSALRDGVLVAQVIAQRLAGAGDVEVVVEDAEEPAAPPAGAPPAVAPAAAGFGAGRRERDDDAFLVRVLPGGVEEDETPIPSRGLLTIGRRGCDLNFPADTSLADRHASISHTEDGWYLRDDGSSSGVFLRLPSRRKLTLTAGDLLCAGRQFLLLDPGGEPAFIHYDASGRELGRHPLPERSIVVGRQAPDVTLDPADRTLSRRQLLLSASGGRVQAKDLQSANGTYLRVRSAVRLEHGDRFRVGGEHFVFSRRDDAVLDPGQGSAVLEGPAAEARAAAPPPAAGKGATVTFAGLGKSFEVAPGQTLCEVAEANGVALTSECHAGICGSDPLRILAGAENLVAPPTAEEAETLEEICGLEAGECRLACMLRIKGPVTVEIL